MAKVVPGKKGFQPNVPYPEDAEVASDPIEREERYELPQTDLDLDGNSVRVTRLVLTPELVAVAIYEARGMASVAARKLGTTVRTVNRFVKDYDICATAAEEARAMLLDFAEAKLMQKIKAGDIASIIFYLRTQGKERGYTEKQAESAANNKQLQEEAQREALEREQALNERLEQIGGRIQLAGDLDLARESYSDGPSGDTDSDQDQQDT